jgi:hypothetical protein
MLQRGVLHLSLQKNYPAITRTEDPAVRRSLAINVGELTAATKLHTLSRRDFHHWNRHFKECIGLRVRSPPEGGYISGGD